ncbi:hypothetical protein [Candidatus Uabimicrobium sp. HlEnr_7]|uniref:hypothetical protein n=1 Tax=Candidatus Uabimicrobium helgolandensis TaxID=3095367 RepID=UPI0035572EDA
MISNKELQGLLFAKKLTVKVSNVATADHQKLLDANYNDEEILHLVQITSYFNFVNRMAEGLGVKIETMT